MTIDPRTSIAIRTLFHVLGLSCIGGAIFLQILVFTDIATRGYFTAVEHNPIILTSEIVLTVFSVIYFVYTYQRFIKSARRKK